MKQKAAWPLRFCGICIGAIFAFIQYYDFVNPHPRDTIFEISFECLMGAIVVAAVIYQAYLHFAKKKKPEQRGFEVVVAKLK